MTTKQTAQDESTEVTEPVEQETVETVEQTVETTETETPNHEAAGYRRKLREAETARDTLTAQVDTLQRAAVEQVAAAVLAKPAALWAAGVTVADLLAEDGTVDGDKVREAAKSAADKFGLAKPLGGNFVPREGSNPRMVNHTSFEDALRQ